MIGTNEEEKHVSLTISVCSLLVFVQWCLRHVTLARVLSDD